MSTSSGSSSPISSGAVVERQVELAMRRGCVALLDDADGLLQFLVQRVGDDHVHARGHEHDHVDPVEQRAHLARHRVGDIGQPHADQRRRVPGEFERAHGLDALGAVLLAAGDRQHQRVDDQVRGCPCPPPAPRDQLLQGDLHPLVGLDRDHPAAHGQGDELGAVCRGHGRHISSRSGSAEVELMIARPCGSFFRPASIAARLVVSSE